MQDEQHKLKTYFKINSKYVTCKYATTKIIKIKKAAAVVTEQQSNNKCTHFYT